MKSSKTNCFPFLTSLVWDGLLVIGTSWETVAGFTTSWACFGTRHHRLTSSSIFQIGCLQQATEPIRFPIKICCDIFCSIGSKNSRIQRKPFSFFCSKIMLKRPERRIHLISWSQSRHRTPKNNEAVCVNNATFSKFWFASHTVHHQYAILFPKR